MVDIPICDFTFDSLPVAEILINFNLLVVIFSVKITTPWVDETDLKALHTFAEIAPVSIRPLVVSLKEPRPRKVKILICEWRTMMNEMGIS